MHEDEELAPVVRRAVELLRADVEVGAAAQQRVMAQLAHPSPAPDAPPRGWGSLAAIGGLGLAAGLAALMLTRPVPDLAEPSGLREVRFSITDAAASQVSLVGDFNDWNPAGTPLTKAGNGQWIVTLPLAPGSYRFSFLLDGRTWRSDPDRPAALDPDFGTPTSVITVEHSVL